RSYVSTDGTTFAIIDDVDSTLAGNFGIRAEATVGGGGGGGGGSTGDSTPSVSNLSGDLEGNILNISGTGTDSGGDVSQVQVTLQDAGGHTLTTVGPASFSLGSGATSNFIYQVPGMNSYPAAVSATLILIDSSGNRSTPVSANFGNADAGGPNIATVTMNSSSMQITGGPFSTPLQLEVNGVVVSRSPAIKIKAKGAKLKIVGTARTLNVNSGPNRIRLIENGKKSNIFVFVK
ncbi:MAG TPA: hypothetical protein VEZ90_13845, partial [Blastocatellia bacterium]|nr:hypothetical protein [Blastocatellia bacterium]